MKGKRKRGRPRKTWKMQAEKKSKSVGLEREDALNRARWRVLTKANKNFSLELSLIQIDLLMQFEAFQPNLNLQLVLRGQTFVSCIFHCLRRVFSHFAFVISHICTTVKISIIVQLSGILF